MASREAVESCSEGNPGQKRKRQNFKWTEDMHNDLIECLRTYKVNCEFKCTGFDADKAAQYECLRIEMTKKI